MKRSVIISTMLAIGCMASAQSIQTDDGVFRWEGGVSTGLNTDGYFLGLSMAYFPLSTIGVKASLEFAGEFSTLEYWTNNWDYDSRSYDYDDYYGDYCMRFKFNPALVLRTPEFLKWKRQGASFHLFAEPGFILSPGASGSYRPRWFCWDFKGGVTMQIDRCVITAGYGVSNFSLYSGEPYNIDGLPANTEHRTHTGYIAIGYKF